MVRRVVVVIGALVLLAAAAGGVGWLVGEARGQAPTRIAYVDIQRVMVRSAAGVAARDQLQKEMASLQKDFDGKVVEVEKLRDELQKKGALLSAEARKERQETLERKVRELQRLKDDSERELAKKEQELRNRFFADITGVVERVGKQRGFLLIVERRGAGVIYSSPEADITDEIIKAFDQELATKGKK